MRFDVTEHLYRVNFIPRRINLSVWTLSSFPIERKLLSISLRIIWNARTRIKYILHIYIREDSRTVYKSWAAGRRRFAADMRRKSFAGFCSFFLFSPLPPHTHTPLYARPTDRHHSAGRPLFDYNFGNGRPRRRVFRGTRGTRWTTAHRPIPSSAGNGCPVKLKWQTVIY